MDERSAAKVDIGGGTGEEWKALAIRLRSECGDWADRCRNTAIVAFLLGAILVAALGHFHVVRF